MLPAIHAGVPYTLELNGKNKIILKNILFGNVWFCCGQSYLLHQMNIHDVRYAKDIAEANNPEIRLFWIPNTTNLLGPHTDFPSGSWQAAVGENVRPFLAVAHFLAKKIYDEFRIPIGIINASLGGTLFEAWISENGLKDFSMMTTITLKNKDTAYLNRFNRNRGGFQPRQKTDLGLASNQKWFDVTGSAGEIK